MLHGGHLCHDRFAGLGMLPYTERSFVGFLVSHAIAKSFCAAVCFVVDVVFLMSGESIVINSLTVLFAS